MANTGLNLGEAFLLPTPPHGWHLFVVIAPIENDKYLVVNATSRQANSDTSCILTPGIGVPDFIQHESVINYKGAREIDVAKMAQLTTAGLCVTKGTFSPTILSQIQQGALQSRRLKNKYKKRIKEFLGVP